MADLEPVPSTPMDDAAPPAPFVPDSDTTKPEEPQQQQQQQQQQASTAAGSGSEDKRSVESVLFLIVTGTLQVAFIVLFFVFTQVEESFDATKHIGGVINETVATYYKSYSDIAGVRIFGIYMVVSNKYPFGFLVRFVFSTAKNLLVIIFLFNNTMCFGH